jgi:hypothetical protein
MKKWEPEMRFNAHEQKPPEDPFEPFEGTFRARIVKAEMGLTKAGDESLKIEWTVLGPSRSGRRLWSNLVMTNQNPQAVEIAMGKLTMISVAVGRPTWSHESELVGGVCDVVVKIKDDKPEIARVVVPKPGAAPMPAQHMAPAAMRPEPPPFDETEVPF